MNIDILLYIIFIIPILIAGFQIEKLNEKKVFIIWILIAIIIIFIGYMIEDNSNNEMRNISYFGSQMLFIFLIIHKVTRNIYFKIFNREPEFGKFPKYKIDYIYTLLLTIGTMVVPFLLDNFIFKKF
ncbi:hypothetical protein G6N05_15185 [Flavobacterium sp. F372]|uniref:Uncharacterized protein n=1 Tax=Flavobacterium bernardetii TaxID=2813823 RepID=A0ABR7J2Q3_9FLAO|nr:hypothetical protein [Flavobacterium bernardetii]MBC5836236.1 hypothetical protein [Flavobacterium bernardetii]NHF71456.1 hypothetical protein [Flavobacterium bernardetii]